MDFLQVYALFYVIIIDEQQEIFFDACIEDKQEERFEVYQRQDRL